MPLYLYNYGQWRLLGLNQDKCDGAYEIDLQNTSIEITEDRIVAKCGIRRKFVPDAAAASNSGDVPLTVQMQTLVIQDPDVDVEETAPNVYAEDY